MTWLIDQLEMIWRGTKLEFSSPEFYLQIGVVILALFLGWIMAAAIVKRVSVFRDPPEAGVLLDLRSALHRSAVLVLPVSFAIALGIAVAISTDVIGKGWLVKAAQGLVFIFVAYSLAKHFLKNETLIALLKWVGVPIALLYSVGWLDDVILHLEGMTVKIGNIEVSLYAVIRTLLFGFVLFWFGRLSNVTGKRVIRSQESLELGTREVIAKLLSLIHI